MPPKKTKRERSPSATTAKAGNPNEGLCQMFEQLMYYESKSGNKWGGVAYNKVLGVLRKQKTTITSGSEISHLEGVGKASVEKIDEFLKTGKLKKLDDLKELYGPLPETLQLTGSGKSSKGSEQKGTPLTAAQKSKIAKQKETYESMSQAELKAMLKLNNQPVSGNKSDLVERCAEGKVLGALPVCPLCGAGKLRFEGSKGTYKCPGYMDDDEFKACFYTSTTADRTTWKES